MYYIEVKMLYSEFGACFGCDQHRRVLGATHISNAESVAPRRPEVGARGTRSIHLTQDQRYDACALGSM